MKKVIDDLKKAIADYSKRLEEISEEDFSSKTNPEKWSKQEELGHLIDSAHNNLKRFIAAQYETNPKITYDQNFWNKSLNYGNQSHENLIPLWKLMNSQIIEVWNSMPEKNYKRLCDTGKGNVELHSLEWLAEDYVKHMLHHLHHILELEEILY